MLTLRWRRTRACIAATVAAVGERAGPVGCVAWQGDPASGLGSGRDVWARTAFARRLGEQKKDRPATQT